MEGVEVIKKQIKSIERKLKREHEEYHYASNRVSNASENIKIYEKQLKDLKEMIEPYLFVENLEENNGQES